MSAPKSPGSHAPFRSLIRGLHSLRGGAGGTHGSSVYINRHRRVGGRPRLVADLLWRSPSASRCHGSATDRMSLQHIIGMPFGGGCCRTLWREILSSSDFLGGLWVPLDRLGSWSPGQSSEATIAQQGEAPVQIMIVTVSADAHDKEPRLATPKSRSASSASPLCPGQTGPLGLLSPGRTSAPTMPQRVSSNRSLPRWLYYYRSPKFTKIEFVW
jgi:hypothetical protein